MSRFSLDNKREFFRRNRTVTTTTKSVTVTIVKFNIHFFVNFNSFGHFARVVPSEDRGPLGTRGVRKKKTASRPVAEFS